MEHYQYADDYNADDIQPQARPHKRRVGEWRFRIKDVAMITGMALAMSALTGLGAIMLVELVEALLS